MHKYFVSVARLHKNDWVELLKETRFVIKLDNGTGDYTTIINEVLNDDNKTEAVNDTLNEENVKKHIEDFLGTLENVKELYLRNNSYITVNYEILQQFHRNSVSLRNEPVDTLHLAQNDSDFWVPDARRIYQGKKTKIKHFPFIASVHIFDQFTCAGSIIDADLVITAASCLQLAHNNRFYRENPSFLSVRIGSSTYAGGDRVPVLEVYFYPSYNPKTLKNNLAIVRLQRVIKFHKKNKNVKKIRVDTKAWALPSNTDGITLIGWGARTRSNKIYNPKKNRLAMADLYFYDLADCQDVYSKVFVTKKNFCAGFISRGGGACNRDVGAPGVVNGILAGVVSFGSPNCGERDRPTVFTKLGYYIDWIEDIMAQDPPKQSVRITTRRPHLLHTIKSTRPLHDTNFVIEPIDLNKIKDIRELDVRMPHEDTNEFINGEFNSIQLVSTQTFPTDKEIIKQNPDDPKKFVDITRHRDENENKGSPETTYEPPRLNQIYTVIGNFDEDEISTSSFDRIDETSTITDLLARTRAQNKELKNTKPQWQIDPEHDEKSESVEDTNEIPDGVRESITTHNFETATTSISVIDKGFEANETEAEQVLSSDDYKDDVETVIVQQSLPVHPISKEKIISIQTHEKAIVSEKKSGNGHKVKQPVKSFKDQDLDNEIEKFIENLDFEEILHSDELETQVLTDTEFLEHQKNQKVPPVTVNHKRFSLQYQKTKSTLKNYDMFPLRHLVPKDDNIFPLQDKKTKPVPKKYYTFPLQDDKTESAPINDYKYPQQEQEIEPAPTNDHKFPLEDQKTKPAQEKYNTGPLQNEETKSALKNDYIFLLQDRKTKPTPKKYYTVPLQDEETKSVQKIYDSFPLRDPAQKNDGIFPLQDQNIQPAPKKHYVYPQKYQNTKRPPKSYYTFPLQDEETESAPKNDYMYPQQDQEAKPAPTNDHKFPLHYQKTKPPPKKYYLNPQQDQKKKAEPKKFYKFPLQDKKTESAPTNDYMSPQQDQEAEPAPTNDHKFPQQTQKKKVQPQKYFTFPVQYEIEPERTNDYITQQDQGTELALTINHKFPLGDQKTKPPLKNDYTIPLQYEEIKPAQTNDDGFLPQTQKAKLAPTHNVVLPIQNHKDKPAQVYSGITPLQGQEPKPAIKGHDLLTFLYMSDNERKPDDSSQEELNTDTKKFKDEGYRHLQNNVSMIIPMSVIFDVIAEELRTKDGKL